MAQKDRRLILSSKFRELLGNNNVYFQPPQSKVMKYPCVRYERVKIPVTRADNGIYLKRYTYSATLIYTDPDSDMPENMLDLFEYISHDRQYVADNLIHDVYTIVI